MFQSNNPVIGNFNSKSIITQVHHGEISIIQIPLVVGARAFIQATKKGTILAISATPIMGSVNGLEALSICYKKYQDVFEKKNLDRLRQYRPYNCATDLQESNQLPFGPIFNLSLNELGALQEYLEENLLKISFDISSFWQAHLSFLLRKKMVHFKCLLTIVALIRPQ